MNLSQKSVSYIITQNGFNIKKNLGQNFLCDENILSKIVNFANISENDTILEIGPGLGSLTDFLLKKAKKVIAVEIDKELIPILKNKYENNENFELIHGDFLKLTENNPEENLHIQENEKIICVANLPYYITSPILMRLLTLKFVTEINVMVQKEVGSRIFAKPSSKDYGILTLAIQFYSTPVDKFIVSKNCFYPQPNVDSMVIKLNKNNNSYYYQQIIAKSLSEEQLFTIIRESFSQRRKKLINSLSSSKKFEKETIKASLQTMNYDENVRAENLTLDDFIILSSLIVQK